MFRRLALGRLSGFERQGSPWCAGRGRHLQGRTIVAEARDPGTPYGAIGLLAFMTRAAAVFWAAPPLWFPLCHILTITMSPPMRTVRCPHTDVSTFYAWARAMRVRTGMKGGISPNRAKPGPWSGGNFVATDDDSDRKAAKSAARTNGWEDWALLKLDDCPRFIAWLRLSAPSTGADPRTDQRQAPIAVRAVGLPADKSTGEAMG